MLSGIDNVAEADLEMLKSTMSRFSMTAIKSEGQPEDIASIVSYLASKEAHFITGQCITVDGGTVLS
jgi:NAD(P)-dependent dehydrogenase (short-subunit alcohol dehydrogenase family)